MVFAVNEFVSVCVCVHGYAQEHAQVHTHVQKCWIGGLGGESREGELNLTPLKSLKLVRIPETTIL